MQNLLYRSCLFITFLLISSISLHADIGAPVRIEFARYPVPSPDGSTLAFSWAGSIWTVPIDGGYATRLTSSDGYDYMPKWSPDGTKIAFSSDRYGSDDLFVIDARGGTPSRITFSNNGDLLSGWLPSGDGLIFSTRRGGAWPDNRSPYKVMFQDSRGYGPSAPVRIAPTSGLNASMHPDGELLAYEYGPDNGWRQGYRGTHKPDIWIYNTRTEEYTRVTENDAGNSQPQWSGDGNTLYFWSEMNGVGNVWSWSLNSGVYSEVTHVRDTALWNPGLGGPSGDEIIAYERMGGVFIQPAAGGNPGEIEIFGWLNEDPESPEMTTWTSGASEYAISPDGLEMALVVRGEIYCVRTDGVGGTISARLTDHPARDWQISWYPRGDALIFTSDRSGIEQLYRITSDDTGHERLSESRRFLIERLTNNDSSCRQAVISACATGDDPVAAEDVTVAYTRNLADLWLMDGNSGNDRELYSHWGTAEYAFSPDGRWIAYSRNDANYNMDIYIAAVDPSDENLPSCPSDGWQPFPGTHRRDLVPSWEYGEVNITRHPDDDYAPVWSPDGSKLGFTSVRWFDNVDAYFIFLKLADEERSLEKWRENAEPLPALPAFSEPEEAQADEGENVTDESIAEEPEEELIVEIDFTDIHTRARRLTSLEGNEHLSGFSPDGEKIIFMSDSDGSADVWQVDWTGENQVALTNDADPSSITWQKTADRIFFLSGSRINSRKPGGGDALTHNFTATMTIDPLQEMHYKFEELWRTEYREFYDPDFHGRDFGAIRDEYEPLAMTAHHYRDFNDAVNQMLGMLNSSHLWYSDSGRPPSGSDTGFPGWGLVEDSEPGLLIDWITPGTPAAHAECGIETGDRIVSINGFDVGGCGENPVGNWWCAMEGTVGREIEIGYIDTDGETDEIRWTRLIPLDYTSWRDAEYDNWTHMQADMVDELSDGRLGYMHVERMYEGPLERFEQEMYSVAHGKDGVIIDIRWNSGGWITDWLLAMLTIDHHSMTQPRDGGFGYPEDRTPVYTTDIPIAVMCNQWSFSNAEIFAHAIQTLDRGILVGWPTAGGVISTGSTQLADGSTLSLPRRGWFAYDSDTGQLLFNMEGTPAVPDYVADLTPPDIASGIDPQIELAVSALEAEIGHY